MSYIKDPRKTLHAINNRVAVNIPMTNVDLDYVVEHLDYEYIAAHIDIDTLIIKLDFPKQIKKYLTEASEEEISSLIGSKLSVTRLSDVAIPPGHTLKSSDVLSYDSIIQKWTAKDVSDITLGTYTRGTSREDIEETDSIKTALGKLENKINVLDGGEF